MPGNNTTRKNQYGNIQTNNVTNANQRRRQVDAHVADGTLPEVGSRLRRPRQEFEPGRTELDQGARQRRHAEVLDTR